MLRVIVIGSGAIEARRHMFLAPRATPWTVKYGVFLKQKTRFRLRCRRADYTTVKCQKSITGQGSSNPVPPNRAHPRPCWWWGCWLPPSPTTLHSVHCTKFPSSPLYLVRRTPLTKYNGKVGNFVMVKNWSLLFFLISNDNVTLTECFYKLNSFLHKYLCCFIASWKHNNDDKTCSEISYIVSVSNLVQICSIMAELLPFNSFQHNSNHIPWIFFRMWILIVNLVLWPYFQPLYQIQFWYGSCKYWICVKEVILALNGDGKASV